MLWRNLGHADSNGTWVAPISFLDAQKIPARMLNAFFTLDNLVYKLAKQKAGKGKQ